MDVNAVQGNVPGMDAVNAQQTAQANNQGEQAKVAIAETAQQEANKPQIPGLGENVNITV